MSVAGELAKKKAMWLYPKVLGFNPSERWGHSACNSNGLVYVFGGCCGGLHFSDVLVLNLETMAWTTLVTTGHGPGPRDSHSAVLVGHRMLVFGGTNGCKKVNDLHMLDLQLKEWTRPECKGSAPSPRESHTATLLGDDKLIIFGGSGEGEANYLNDLHILDLKAMRWTSPEVKGNIPVPRDSHSAVAIGSKLFVYGGDCGDRYHGDVDLLDMDTLTWSRLAVQGSSPGVRAGHAAVNIRTKVYIIGGVGDKHYYNDVWVLDVSALSWTQLEICGQQPQGRFSHTAIVADSDIAIYGGCGEDERPLNELLVLQLGADHPNGRYNISLCKIFGNHLNQGKRRFSLDAENSSHKTMVLGSSVAVRKEAHDPELDMKQSFRFTSDTLHPKRRRTSNSKIWEIESEQEEHSLSLSQNSSPSQSDQEQTPALKATDSVSASPGFPFFKQRHQVPRKSQSNNVSSNQNNPRTIQIRPSQDLHLLGEHPNEMRHSATEQRLLDAGSIQNLIGADVRGIVDGAFDSGFLMTATVNGKLFRGVLFTPGPGIVPRGAAPAQNFQSPTGPVAVAQPFPNLNHVRPTSLRQSPQPVMVPMPESSQNFRQAQVTCSPTMARAAPSLRREPSLRSDLHGVVLTLGGPGSGHGRS